MGDTPNTDRTEVETTVVQEPRTDQPVLAPTEQDPAVVPGPNEASPDVEVNVEQPKAPDEPAEDDSE